jgi:aconitate hydratase
LQYVLRQLLGEREQPQLISGALPAGAVIHGRITQDAKVEEGSIESFPASDPPAY